VTILPPFIGCINTFDVPTLQASRREKTPLENRDYKKGFWGETLLVKIGYFSILFLRIFQRCYNFGTFNMLPSSIPKESSIPQSGGATLCAICGSRGTRWNFKKKKWKESKLQKIRIGYRWESNQKSRACSAVPRSISQRVLFRRVHTLTTAPPSGWSAVAVENRQQEFRLYTIIPAPNLPHLSTISY
jgi:hypothetical protein